MSKDKKLKKISASPHIKIPETKADYDAAKPVFSLKHIQYLGRYCPSQCGEEQKALILATLLRLSQSTWRDIRRMPKEQGFETIPRHRFDIALPPILTPEVAILVTRYDGGGRLAGYRDRDIYHIVLVGEDLYSH